MILLNSKNIELEPTKVIDKFSLCIFFLFYLLETYSISFIFIFFSPISILFKKN